MHQIHENVLSFSQPNFSIYFCKSPMIVTRFLLLHSLLLKGLLLFCPQPQWGKIRKKGTIFKGNCTIWLKNFTFQPIVFLYASQLTHNGKLLWHFKSNSHVHSTFFSLKIFFSPQIFLFCEIDYRKYISLLLPTSQCPK